MSNFSLKYHPTGKRINITSCLLVLIVMLMTACAQIPGAEPRVEADNFTKGILATSVSYTAGTRTMNAWFYVRKRGVTNEGETIRLDAKPLFSMSGGSGLSSMFRNIDFPDSPDHDGRVIAMSLEPGEYELYSWTLYIQLAGGYGYISPSTPPPPLPFSVSAGRITYLGNLHGQTLMGKNFLGLDVPSSGRALITDKTNRDIPMIIEKYPMLDAWPISNAKLDGQTWLPPQ